MLFETLLSLNCEHFVRLYCYVNSSITKVELSQIVVGMVLSQGDNDVGLTMANYRLL